MSQASQGNIKAFPGKAELTVKGWVWFETCGCGNTTTYKYHLPGTGTELHIKPDRNRFQVIKKSIMTSQHTIDYLTTFLNVKTAK